MENKDKELTASTASAATVVEAASAASDVNVSIKSAEKKASAKESKHIWKKMGAKIKAASKKSWAWIKSRDLATTTNVAMLVLVVVMLVVLINVAQQNNLIMSSVNNAQKAEVVQNDAQVKKIAAKKAKIRVATVQATVSINEESGKTAIVLPLKKVVKVYDTVPTKIEVKNVRRQTNNEWLQTEEVIRPVQKRKIDSMETIKGNLYVQNMNSYTIPCGTRVMGNLIVRNVKNLKFCDCFEVMGNMYIGRGTAFGPIPADAKIHGQIVY
jgi:hypothetical protein